MHTSDDFSPARLFSFQKRLVPPRVIVLIDNLNRQRDFAGYAFFMQVTNGALRNAESHIHHVEVCCGDHPALLDGLDCRYGIDTADGTGDGGAVGPFGVMGADMQPQGHVQMVVNQVDYGMNPQTSLDAPRWRWLRGREVLIEPAAGRTLIDGLVARGHLVSVADTETRFNGNGGQGTDNSPLTGRRLHGGKRTTLRWRCCRLLDSTGTIQSYTMSS